MEKQHSEYTYLLANLSTHEIRRTTEKSDVASSFIGGRGWGVKQLFDRVKAGIDPFSSQNVLVFAIGPFSGTLAPSSGRVEVMAKSPLTGLLGRANAGGHWGPELRYCGLEAVVVTGRSPSPCYLWITDDRWEIREASHLWGKDTFETNEIVRGETHLDAKVASIGIAGERLVRYASIMFTIYRSAGRTGIGAVMGSKNLKAIALRGSRPIYVKSSSSLIDRSAEIRKRLKKDSLLQMLGEYGSPGLIEGANAGKTLPTHNWREGTFGKAYQIGGKALKKNFLRRMRSCFSCPVHCRPFHYVGFGEYQGTFGSGPEYETLAALGSRVCVSDLAAICYGQMLCNRYGLDVISTGQVIASAMEWHETKILPKEDIDGLDLKWGNASAMLKMIEKIATREGIGDLLAEGSKRAARILGASAYPALVEVKGLELPGIDPRACKGWGLAFAVATRGGDHLTSFHCIESNGSPVEGKRRFGTEEAVNPFSHEGKARMVVWHEHVSALCDSLPLCKYPTLQVESLDNAISVNDMSLLLDAITGVRFTESELLKIGERIINLEKLFNVREKGGGREDDYLPMRLLKEPSLSISAPSRSEIDLEHLKDEYYAFRGWDTEKGISTANKAKDLGLYHEFQQAMEVCCKRSQ